MSILFGRESTTVIFEMLWRSMLLETWREIALWQMSQEINIQLGRWSRVGFHDDSLYAQALTVSCYEYAQQVKL